MKKIFSSLLVIATLLSSVAIPGYAEENASYYEPTEKESLLMNLGLIDKDGYNGNDNMTRGEFAVLLAKTLGLETDRGRETSTAVPGVDDSEVITPVNLVFKDVDKTSAEYGAIMTVYENRYMSGLSEEIFAPEYGLVMCDAIKVFVDLLGFSEQAQAQGGYPTGYEKLASSFNIYRGVSCGFDGVATKKDIANLLYNVMDTPVAKAITFESDGINYSTSRKDTFMTDVMKIQKISGIMTDNGITAIDGPSAVSTDKVICDGVEISISDEVAYARKLLGRKIQAYCSIDDENDEYKLIYAAPKDEAIVISEKDYLGYNNGVLKYGTKGGSSRKANIGVYSSVIYNGVYMSSYTKDIFDVTDGQITLIKKDNGYNVIIEDYKSIVVSKTEEEKSAIYSRIRFDSERYGFDELLLDRYQEVLITDEHGAAIPFSAISDGDVLSCLLSPDFRYAELVLCRNRIEDVTFACITEDEYETDEEIYIISDTLKNAANLEQVRLGKKYTLYFSAFGTLVWVDYMTGSADGLREGIVLKYLNGEYDADYGFGVKIYTSNGLVKTYHIQEKFKLNNKTVKAEKAYIADEGGSESGLLCDLNIIGKPVLYKDEDSVITEMITPLGYNEEDDKRGWYQITYDYLEDESKDKGLKHIDAGNGASFGGMLSYDRTNCNIYAIPHSSIGTVWDTRELITLNETEFVNHQEYRIEGYAKTKDAICADVLVNREKGTSSTPDSRVALLITDVQLVLDADMELVTSFAGYEFVQPGTVTKTSYVVSDEAKIVDENNVVTGKTYKDLSEGDIIRISKNARGEISTISVSYDFSDDKVANITCREQAYTHKGYVMNIDEQGFKIAVPGVITAGGSTQNVFYTPSQVKDYIKNASSPEQLKEGFQMTRTYLAGANYPVVIVDGGTRKPTFTQASLNDVFAYESTPGRFDTVVVFTHYLGGKMGAVVYR